MTLGTLLPFSSALIYVNTSRPGMLVMSTTRATTIWTASTVYGLGLGLSTIAVAAPAPAGWSPVTPVNLDDDDDNDEEMMPFDDCDMCDMEPSDDDGDDDDDDIETDEETADQDLLDYRRWLWGLVGEALPSGDLAKGVGS